MDPLATITDMTDRVGLEIDFARANACLVDASAAVRRVTGQTLSEATTTVRLTPGRDRLGQRPVTAIVSAVDDNGTTVDVTSWTAEGEITAPGPVTVTYTHGYPTIPDDIVAIVCQVAARSLTAPVGAITQFYADEAPPSYAASGRGGVELLSHEVAQLAAYRRPRRPIRMLT
jgi:hypothetical protein